MTQAITRPDGVVVTIPEGADLLTDKPLAVIEREWRNGELSRTDRFIALPDFPYSADLADYRQLLRDYQFDGSRPEMPLTQTGKPIC